MNSLEKFTNEVTDYKGIEIRGLDFLENEGIATKEEVFEVLDSFPDKLFDAIRLDKIVFENQKMFNVSRGDENYFVYESEILPGDKIERRARGWKDWNSEIVNGNSVISDGGQSIYMFSTKDWEGENDKDVALYGLVHEIGHAIFDAYDIDQGVEFWNHLGNWRDSSIKIIDLNLPGLWRDLPKSNLKRYLDYIPHFTRERGRQDRPGEEEKRKTRSLENVALGEDFAISNEHYIYWKDLGDKDKDRYNLLRVLYEEIANRLQE
jgi:hypothetical protein